MSPRLIRPRRAAALVMLITIAACSAQAGGTSNGAPATQTVSVTVSPDAVVLAPAQTTQFAAAVTGTTDLVVAWTVQETAGGTVDGAGLYKAPADAGTYHVKATSDADPTVSSVATITVAVPPAGSITVSPKTATVAAGGTVTFTAAASNLPSGDVTWSIRESGCGAVSSSGVYTAPAGGATCHVVATSADGTRSDAATVTVSAPIRVSVSSGSSAVDACKTLTFTASVTGSSNQAVTWSVVEAGGGAISSTGVYTAPATAGTYHVMAAAQASSAATAQATVTVKDHILSIALTPTTASLTAGGTQQFAATVTTTCGTFAAASP